MSFYETFAPYFNHLQSWHIWATLGGIGFLALWQVEKWKIDRETDIKANKKN